MGEPWYEKFARMQRARGWSNSQAVEAFIAASPTHSTDQRDAVETLLKRYRRGDVASPDQVNQATIAAMFDLPVGDFFPQRALADENVPAKLSPTEFTDLVGALRMPRVAAVHLEQAEAEVERLCSAYAFQDARVLTSEVDEWLRLLVGLVSEGRVNLAGHRQVLHLSGWLALLRACLMWDQNDERSTLQARTAAEGFAEDLGDGVIGAWGWEIRAWMALTSGDMPNVVAASDAGLQRAPSASVAAQLWAQKAKAYARMRDAHKTEVALHHVREILDGCELPGNLRNHFAVDPTKASFYAMDSYRTLGAATSGLADAMADTVIATSTTPLGEVISPMRLAEAQLTKAVLAAREGATDTALTWTERAFAHDRRSAPSLMMVAGDVARELGAHDPGLEGEFREHLQSYVALAMGDSEGPSVVGP